MVAMNVWTFVRVPVKIIGNILETIDGPTPPPGKPKSARKDEITEECAGGDVYNHETHERRLFFRVFRVFRGSSSEACARFWGMQNPLTPRPRMAIIAPCWMSTQNHFLTHAALITFGRVNRKRLSIEVMVFNPW